MLKSSALLLRCWWKKKDLIGSFLVYNLLLSWWSNTIYEFHPNSSQHFESHSICQPISDTWHVTFFLPRCSPSLSPPTSSFPASNEQRWTTQRTSGVRAPGPLNQPPSTVLALFLRSAARRMARSTAFLRSWSKALSYFIESPKRSDQLTDFKTWSRTGTNSREERDRVFSACHLCWRKDDDFGILLALFFAYVCIE